MWYSLWETSGWSSEQVDLKFSSSKDSGGWIKSHQEITIFFLFTLIRNDTMSAKWVSFDIKCTRQDFENACWHRETCQAIQNAFSKLSLVNLIIKRQEPGILFISWFTLQTSNHDVMVYFYCQFEQRLWRCHSKSATSSWPDKGTCCEIDNVFQAMCNAAVNMNGNW